MLFQGALLNSAAIFELWINFHLRARLLRGIAWDLTIFLGKILEDHAMTVLVSPLGVLEVSVAGWKTK